MDDDPFSGKSHADDAGRFDMGVDPDTVDFEIPRPIPGVDTSDFQISRQL